MHVTSTTPVRARSAAAAAPAVPAPTMTIRLRVGVFMCVRPLRVSLPLPSCIRTSWLPVVPVSDS